MTTWENTIKIREMMEVMHNPTTMHTKMPFHETIQEFYFYDVRRYRIDFTNSTATAYASFHCYRQPYPERYTVITIRIPRIKPANVFNETKIKEAAADDYRQYELARGGWRDHTIYSYEDLARRASVEGGVTDMTAYIDGQRIVYMGAMGEVLVGFYPWVKPGESREIYIPPKESRVNIVDAIWNFMAFWSYGGFRPMRIRNTPLRWIVHVVLFIIILEAWIRLYGYMEWATT